MPTEPFRASDPAVVSRFLQLRSLLHDHYLATIERHVLDHYAVSATRRVASTLVTVLRCGFVRPGEGELWPAVFMTTVDVSLGLCVELPPERVAGLGTMLNGPQRLRQRAWDGWWGWEQPLGRLRADFFDLDAEPQEELILGWYVERLEWLAGAGLLRRKA